MILRMSRKTSAVALLWTAACLAAIRALDEFRWPTDTAFEQIRHYGAADIAVNLDAARL